MDVGQMAQGEGGGAQQMANGGKPMTEAEFQEAVINVLKGKGKGGKGGFQGQCYNCWEWGHSASNCPKPPKGG